MKEFDDASREEEQERDLELIKQDDIRVTSYLLLADI